MEILDAFYSTHLCHNFLKETDMGILQYHFSYNPLHALHSSKYGFRHCSMSQQATILTIPNRLTVTRLKFGDRAFSISASRLWNALPQHLKDSTLCQAFKKCLKTPLFRLPIEVMLTMTQTMTMCSAFEHFMNGKGAI